MRFVLLSRSLGRLGLQEIASQCEVELGRDHSHEQKDLHNMESEYGCEYDFVMASTKFVF